MLKIFYQRPSSICYCLVPTPDLKCALFCQYDATPTKIIEGFDHWLSVSRDSMMTLFKSLWALGNQCIKSLTFKRSIIEHDQFFE